MIRPSLVLLLLALAVAGCNTMRGLGADIEVAGDALNDTAGELQRGF
jgi:predicted small secreted protein